MAGLRTSVGIWAFGPNATRFMPGGYHPEAARETILQRTQRAAEALRGVADGFEYHYPSEINDDTAPEIRKALGGMDIYCLALGLFSDPRYGLGGFIHPDRRRRAEVVETAKAGVTWPRASGRTSSSGREGKGTITTSRSTTRPPGGGSSKASRR